MNEYVGTAPDIIEMELNMEINPCTGSIKLLSYVKISENFG